MSYPNQLLHRAGYARVVGSGPRPLVILSGTLGTSFDFLLKVEHHVVYLVSGATLHETRVISLPETPVVRQIGRGLWEAIASLIRQSTWEEIEKRPGASLSPQNHAVLTAQLFATAAENGGVIAGKQEPVKADSAFIRFMADAPLTWDFDWVTETATPRVVESAATYVQVRVFTAEQWRAISGQTALLQTELPTPTQPKAKYSSEALAAWFLLREHTWPPASPFPNLQQDRAAAEIMFDELPSRDEFRQIRAGKTSENWRKQGPRVRR